MFALLVSLCLSTIAISSAGVPLTIFENDQLPQNRIIGGNFAELYQFPYQISMQLNSRHFCGGSIIAPEYVLTAAHCVNHDVISQAYIKAGKLKLQETESDEQIRTISNIYIHEKYGGEVGPYDIAIIKVNKPFVYSKCVKPVFLPQNGKIHEGNVTLSGWGSITPTRFSIPDNLRYVNLPIVDYESCKKAMYELISKDLVEESNVCTGPLYGGVSACAGDSGGPLVQVESDGRIEIIGIVSWGNVPCGIVGSPSVYTRVSAYREWIDNILYQ